ncbi:Slp family lipoprotein [Thioalkalivibrio sp. AKL19]|uniref:Slp family lipoprotein n=1 Tax=Thioalkalivibrio sp. AKL19 TaxID=1266914 RepID=UPI00040DCC1B|nr:Slp family lipoprotein [Thioalkalivibrio sp. AKL19]
MHMKGSSISRGRVLVAAGLMFLLVGCAGVPASLAPLPAAAPDREQVLADPAAAKGETVVWGGVIAAVENTSGGTRLEVVGRDLDRQGRPQEADRSPGRFRAVSSGFLDPQIYAEGREVTVRGVIQGTEEGTIGDYAYAFVTLQADAVYLWPRRPPPSERHHRDPFYDPLYDPFYSPWGPRYGAYGRYHPHPWYW